MLAYRNVLNLKYVLYFSIFDPCRSPANPPPGLIQLTQKRKMSAFSLTSFRTPGSLFIRQKRMVR